MKADKIEYTLPPHIFIIIAHLQSGEELCYHIRTQTSIIYNKHSKFDTSRSNRKVMLCENGT